MTAQLAITAGPDAGRVCELQAGREFAVGRGSRCDLRLEDPSVSRVHCRLEVAAGRATLIDAGSKWGTQVNGRSVERYQLQSGDRIQIGDTELEYQADDDARATAVSRAAVRIVSDVEVAAAAVFAAPTLPPSLSAPPDLNALVGSTFVRYRVESVLARSATGTVYRAVDLKMPRIIALKIYWPAMFADEAAKARFLRAIRSMVDLSHPHLVKLHAAGRSRGLCFTASEFVEGESTGDLIRRIGVAGMLDWQTAWKMAVGLAEALEFLHARSILHRSVLPNNILIRAGDKAVKLGDSMLAKALDDIGAPNITQRGEIVGDLYYLAPEQVSGGPQLDQRSDLYGLGATIYAVLTGRPPFLGGPTDVVGQILSAPPEPPSKYHLAIPPAFEGIVLRLLAKRPDDRYANAAQLLKDLHRVGMYLGVEPM
ncbi:MAG: FHA domain-containing serine/threonine-protein kinase [Planctomycetaceae bacterium]|nr:FHA domain-containing serine/threonine-protein kinase [Planctomycetaceae bacterium]